MLRGFRFETIYNDATTDRRSLYGITFCYGMLNYILPAKTGEIAYIVLAKIHLSYNIIQNITVIINARFFDIIEIALILTLIFLKSTEMPGWMLSSLIIFEILVLSIVFILFLIRNYGNKFLYKINHYIPRRFLQQVIQHARILNSAKVIWSQTLIAILIWLCIYANFYCIISAIGFNPSLDQVILISVVMIPLTLLPQGVANIGTHEIAWIFVFQLYGVGHQESLQIAVTSHILLLLNVFLIGIIGLFLIYRAKVR